MFSLGSPGSYCFSPVTSGYYCLSPGSPGNYCLSLGSPGTYCLSPVTAGTYCLSLGSPGSYCFYPLTPGTYCLSPGTRAGSRRATRLNPVSIADSYGALPTYLDFYAGLLLAPAETLGQGFFSGPKFNLWLVQIQKTFFQPVLSAKIM